MTESDVELITAAATRAAPAASSIVVAGQRIRLLRDGREAYPAMLAAIGAARHEVVLEMYWFGSDAVGRQFIDALIARAREGVSVRVVYDAIGSSPVDHAMFDDLRAAGGDVRPYHPLLGILRPSAFSRWFIRDHRKLLVCDTEVGFTGGLNIGRPWAPREQGGEGWRDDMVEVQGPAARELRALFYETWRSVLKRRERRRPEKLPPDAGVLAGEPTSDVWVMANRRPRRRRTIRNTYLRWIVQATKAIDIVNAYFVPDWGLRRALVRAARRGVEVRVLVPERGDVTFVQWAVEATLERLVRSGVKAFAYRGAVLHSKTAVCDEMYATIGSYNLDHRSLRYNLEVNLAIHGEAFAQHVRKSIDADIAVSVPWTYEVLRNRGFFRRLLGEFALLFARFL
jgi:cardiolipin synthase